MAIRQKIFIFGLLFSLLNCTCGSYDDFDLDESSSTMNYVDNNASKKTCPKRSFSEEEIAEGAYKCCYQRVKCQVVDQDTGETGTLDFKGCTFATKSQYDAVKDIVKGYKSLCSEVEINCFGTSLSYFYLVVILLFLL